MSDNAELLIAAQVALNRHTDVLRGLGRVFADAGHDLYLVGGSVRDALLGRLGTDLDFTTDARPEVVGEMEDCVADGITSFKVFMAYKGALMVDDEQFIAVLEQTGRTGGLVMVHCENGDAVVRYQKEAMEAGNTDPRFHAWSRPPEVEGEATGRAIRLAEWTKRPLFVVHVTCEDAVVEIQRARDRGLPIFGETCLQYLFLTVDELAARSHMSRRTFTRQFRARMGASPLQWLLQQRTLRAQRLLETTDLPVEAVAHRSGFGSAVALRSHFQAALGTSPREYRVAFSRQATAPLECAVAG